jgi:hypothetical protein
VHDEDDAFWGAKYRHHIEMGRREAVCALDGQWQLKAWAKNTLDF